MMERLSDLRLFVAVVDAGGFAAGGRRLNLSPATVSERIAALEASTGARLLVRTTRLLALTDEGRLLVETARGILAEIDDLGMRLRDGAERLSGHVRLSAPVDLGRNRIASIVDGFLADHPDVSVELILSDGFGDLIADGIDFAVRFGALDDSSLIAVRIGDNRRVACAAPDYLARKGLPADPYALRDHDCLVMRFGTRRDDRWRFRHDGREVTVAVSGARSANDGDLIRAWAIAGHGIAMKSIWDVADDLEAGRLIEVLSDHAIARGALQIVYPSGRPLPRRCRAIIDHVSAALTGEMRQE